MVSLIWRFALVVAALGTPCIAAAADLPVQSPSPPAASATYAPATYAPAVPDWIVTIGLEGRALPAWPGSPDNKFVGSVMPLFSVRKAGTPPDYFGPRDSFGFTVLDLGPFKFGPAFKAIWQRKASNYAALNGLGNVDASVQAGGFVEYWPVTWLRLRGELRQGIGGETGLTGDLFLDAIVPAGQFRFSAGPRMTWQTAAATSPYFGITAAQAAAANAAQPGLPALTPYNASGGLYSYGAGGQVEYFLNPQWSAHIFTEYERLTDSAADSPLVTQRGSPNEFTYGLGATYSFNMKPLW